MMQLLIDCFIHRGLFCTYSTNIKRIAMSMKKLLYKKIPQEEMLNRVNAYYDAMSSRRSIRDFSSKPVSIDIITQSIKTACGAPSGANKQPWTN